MYCFVVDAIVNYMQTILDLAKSKCLDSSEEEQRPYKAKVEISKFSLGTKTPWKDKDKDLQLER